MTNDEASERGVEGEVTAVVTVLVQIESGRGIITGVIAGAEVVAEAGPAAVVIVEAAAAVAAMTDMREGSMYPNMFGQPQQVLTCFHQPPGCRPCHQVQMSGHSLEMNLLQGSCLLLRIRCPVLLILLQSRASNLQWLICKVDCVNCHLFEYVVLFFLLLFF